ncbi:DUF7007 domain-containing protein [Sphingobium sp. RAC03]|uniref:DUF7007 domain-containing protein n=1 Tax=Sphingobium sp. RAC03 TaxID=1843368 RepID=UPI0008552B62|nr:hypothetical protein [Sphingobium sp. RAC03]AOF98548.1 hypothetical protein BSY17_4086 [Sphingobium sp. RAC03]
MSFESSAQPVASIWGGIATADQILPGVWHVSTASHGGLILSAQRQQAMPGALRLEGVHYEEDVDWSLVYLAFEAELKLLRRPGMAASLQLAHDIARNWHPRRYGDFTGIAVAPRDSYVMRRRAAYQAVIGEIVVTAAFGTHEAWVPAGKTGLFGRRVASVDHLGWAKYDGPDVRALVDAARYDSGNIVNSFAAIGAELI